jgi:hypothetical protein
MTRIDDLIRERERERDIAALKESIIAVCVGALVAIGIISVCFWLRGM